MWVVKGDHHKQGRWVQRPTSKSSAFPQNLHTKKLGEITVFYPVCIKDDSRARPNSEVQTKY